MKKIKNKASDVKESIEKKETKLGDSFKVKQFSDVTNSEVDWHGQEIETKSDPLVDGGSGRPVILRMFEYRYPPGFKGELSSEKILTKDYINFLKNTLYFTDELELIQHPKVVFGTKGFKIFATCQAKKGSLILNRPKLLQDVTQNKNEQ